MGQRVIAVTGLPGSHIARVVGELQRRGGQVLWGGQDTQLAESDTALARGQNIELLRMHESILQRAGKSWFTLKAPRYYDIPYPGPEEYLAQFPDNATVLLGDPRLVFFFPMWNRFVTQLYVCGIPPELSASLIYKQVGGRADLSQCHAVAQHYRSRMHETVTAAMSRHTRLPFPQLQDGSFTELLDLKSTF